MIHAFFNLGLGNARHRNEDWIMTINDRCPFAVGESVIDELNPAHIGTVTGRISMAGPIIMVEVRYPDGSTPYIPADQLNVIQGQPTLVERLTGGMFGRAQDLRRTITYEKLKETLSDLYADSLSITTMMSGGNSGIRTCAT